MKYKWQYNNLAPAVYLEDENGLSFACHCPNEKMAEKVTSALNFYLMTGMDKDVFERIPDYGDVYTIDVFVELCKEGSLIDYDGSGYYAYVDKMSRMNALPSKMVVGDIEKEFTHVVWFNK